MESRLSKLVFLFLLIPIQTLFSQDIDEQLRRLIEQNKVDELRNNLEDVKNKYPQLYTPYYIEAYLETDGEKAFLKYKEFLKQFPQSPYVINAQFKIAQYYFARGLYRSAKQILNHIIENFPDSPFADDAHYLKIRSLSALEINDEAKSEIKSFLRKYSQSPFKNLAEQDLKDMDKAVSSSYPTSESEKPSRSYSTYAIQVGAFSQQDNAIKQMNTLAGWDYETEIIKKFVNNSLLYLVWIGNFETEEQALNFGEVFKKKYGMAFRVVQKDTAP